MSFNLQNACFALMCAAVVIFFITAFTSALVEKWGVTIVSCIALAISVFLMGGFVNG